MRTIDIIKYRNEKAASSPVTQPVGDWEGDLRSHLGLCQEILAVIEKETQWLRDSESSGSMPGPIIQEKKQLLVRLTASVERLHTLRLGWQNLPPSERAQNPVIGTLIRQNQDVTMKIMLLDRENEQLLLRKGLVPPQHMPPAQRQRPNFVAQLYRNDSNKT